MPIRSLIVVIAFAALAFAAPDALAQTSRIAQPPEPAPLHHARGRITIHPGRLLYRRCVDWYELQHRPSGTVLFPEMRCWWVRG